MSRTRRSILTYTSGLASTAVTIVLGMVALPLLLTRLGQERYGAFRALMDWYGYVALFELGLDGALLALFARAIALRDGQRVQQTLAIGIRAYLGLTCIMVAAGIGLAVVIKHLVPVEDLHAADLRLACGIAIAALLVVPLSPFRSLTDACQEGYLLNLLSLAQCLVTTALALWLASRDWGISGQISAVAIGNILVLGAVSVRHYQRLPGGRHGMACGDWSAGEIRRDLRRLNKPILLRRICGRVGLLSDCLIVSALLGPTLVVPLYVTQRLAALVQTQLQAIGSASWAGLAALYAQGQLQTFNRRLVELTNLVAVLGVTVLVPIIAYNHYFIDLWIGGQHYGGDFLTVVAACNAFLLSITTLWDWCFGGTGQVARLVPLSLVSTIVNVTLSIVFTRQLGPVGPLLGTLSALATCSIWYLPYLLRQVFQTSPRELIKAVAGPLAWSLPYGGFLWWFARSHKPWGWIGLAAEMGTAAVLFLASWWLVGFAGSDRAVWVQRVKAVFRCAA